MGDRWTDPRGHLHAAAPSLTKVLGVSAAASRTLRAFESFARAQRAMYRGEDPAAVHELLTPDVVWHVPGTSAIAGDHRGRAAVMDYFTRRRSLAGGVIEIVVREQLVSADVVIQRADGELERDGQRLRWRTAGVYRLDGERVAEAWLVPLELAAFDAIWTERDDAGECARISRFVPSANPGVDADAGGAAEQVRALELRLLDPVVRRDRAAVDRLLSPDFVEIGVSGRVWDKRSVLDLLSADTRPPPAVSDLRAEWLSPDAILVTYRAHRPGAAISMRASVWLRDADGWRVRFHQGTPVSSAEREATN
jgi:ketosteroid isomerase-like protein